MFSLAKLTIKKKLTFILMLTSTVAVLLACFIFIIYSTIIVNEWHTRGLLILADSVSSNCQAALKFNIPVDGKKVLGAFQFDPTIVFACIYDTDKNVFATYTRDPNAQITPPKAEDSKVYRKAAGTGHLFRPVWFNEELIGHIYIRDDRSELEATFRNQNAIL